MEKSSTLHDAAATNPRKWATTDPPQWRGGAGLACDESATLLRLTKLFERSSEAAKIGVWECNLDGEQLTWTDVVYDIFDLPRGSRLDRAEILRFYPSTSRAELERVRSRAIECGEGFTLDVQIHTAKGRDKWIRITATVEREHEVPIRIFGLKQDITTERLLVEQTRYLAEYDSLTGLANRATFQRSLDALASASPPRGTLLLLDLDGFKQVNDRHGHAQGDACLQQLARRLRSVCADAKVVARIGGDEFAILIDQQASHEHTKSVSERIIEAFRSPIMSGSESFVLGASIGIAHFGAGQNDSDAASIFTDADLALYEAKSAGKNVYCFFEQKLRGKLNKRVSTIATIEAALTASRLTLYYQPIVRIATGALLGFEALLRHHTVGGQIVGPVEFTDAMDDPALSARVGGWVLREGIGQAARWRDAGLAYGRLSINMNQAHLNRADFAQTLLDELAHSKLTPESIELEIAEGVFMNGLPKSALEQLRFIQSKGVSIALDDFGTGNASLVHLRDYPIDVIKVARSFVPDVLTSASDAAILECVISLARRLDKMLVVEGVETAEQLAYLRGLECKFAQGNLFSAAVPACKAGDIMRSGAFRLPNRKTLA